MNSYITKILVFKNIAVHFAVTFLGSKLIPMKKSFIMCQQALADPRGALGTRAPRSIFFSFSCSIWEKSCLEPPLKSHILKSIAKHFLLRVYNIIYLNAMVTVFYASKNPNHSVTPSYEGIDFL